MESAGPVPVLVVTGPTGVGKTSVADAVASQLRAREIGHAFIDLDQLRLAYPHPEGDRSNERLALRNLAAIWPNYRDNGAECAVLPTVVETRDGVNGIAASIPKARVLVVRLHAPLIVIRERLQSREHGIALTSHLQRAAELMDVFDHHQPQDITIATEGRSVPEIATEILEEWLPD
jgi:adenylylsulfate kinase-like enzyme